MNEKKTAAAPIEELGYVLWNRDTLPSRREGYAVAPFVTVNASTGRIAFSSGAIKVLELTKGMGAEFIQAGRHMDEWYVARSTRREALPVSLKKGGSNCHSNYLAKTIAESLKRKADAPVFRIQLATKPTTFADHREDGSGVITAYALITLNIQDVAKKGGQR